MRLNNYKSPKLNAAGEPEGPSADIVEHILQTSEKRRSRPTSSLDIKVDGGSKMTTPPSKSGEKKQAKAAPKEQQQQQRRHAHHQTRARRGRLPSHKNFEGMDEDDLLQVLYEDPELMAAAEASQQQAKKGTGTKKYGKKSKLNEYPDHLKSMMDEGVPVTQWIIVLVLLGAAVYQLRKSLMGPKKTAAASATKAGTKKVTERGMGRKNGKQKGKKALTKAKGKLRNNAPRSTAQEKAAEIVSPIEEELESELSVVENKAAKRKAASKKKSRRQRANKPARSTTNAVDDEGGSHESPDSVSTDGSSSTEIVPQSEEDRGMMANLTEESQLSPEEMRVDSEGWQTMATTEEEGWQTVRGSDKVRKRAEPKKTDVDETPEATAAEGNESNVAKEVSQAATPDTNEVVPDSDKGENAMEDDEKSPGPEPASWDKGVMNEPQEQVEDGAKEAAPFESETEAVPPAAQPEPVGSGYKEKEPAKNKKKKKKGKKNKSAATQEPIDKKPLATQNGNANMSDDEALALKLQQEEDKFARSTPLSKAAPVEEVWEEVSKPKRKKKSPAPVEE